MTSFLRHVSNKVSSNSSYSKTSVFSPKLFLDSFCFLHQLKRKGKCTILNWQIYDHMKKEYKSWFLAVRLDVYSQKNSSVKEALKFLAGSSPPCVQLWSCHEQLIIFYDLEDCSISPWHPLLKTPEACACIRLFYLNVDQRRNGLKSFRGA